MKLKNIVITSISASIVAAGLAYAGGLYTPGLPLAGSVPNTFPLTGNELIPADTQLSGGLVPQTEAISVGQLIGSAAANAFIDFNISTTDTEATPIQITGVGGYTILQMTGTLTGNSVLTTPTAAQLYAELPNVPHTGNFILRIENLSSANFSWTLNGGTGVNIFGSPTIPQNTYVDFIVDLDPFATVIQIRRVGSGPV